MFCYPLLVAMIERTPYTHVASLPTRNLTSHISGMSIISFRLSLNDFVQLTRARTSTSCVDFLGRTCDEDPYVDDVFDASESTSDDFMSVLSYPEDESITEPYNFKRESQTKITVVPCILKYKR